jgi:hypothetical protein
MFLNLAQYFSMDRRTIVPILSTFRYFSMVLPFILKHSFPLLEDVKGIIVDHAPRE